MTDRPSRVARAGRVLYALVAIPLLGVVGLGLAAAVLPPGRFWWVQLVAIGLPYAAWALVASLAVAAVLRWTPAVVLHLALLGLVVLRVGLPARVASPTVRAGDLRLTTFNLPQSGPSEESLKDSASAFVADLEPDLLLLQDTWVRSDHLDNDEAVHVDAIVTRAPYRLEIPDDAPRIEGRDGGHIGVPILVRAGSGVEVLDQESVVPPGGPDVSIALRSRVRWQDREFVVYNLHVRSFGRDKPWEDAAVSWVRPSSWRPYLRQYRTVYAQREGEVEQIAARIEAETLPVVVAGDFNSTTDNWTTRRIRQAGARRTDAYHTAAGLAWGRTYHAARPLVRIDYVFVDPAFEVTSARAVDVGFSDHRPVSVTLRWAEE